MTNGLASIISQLVRQQTAIDRALVALRGVEGSDAPTPATPATTATPEGSGRKKKRRTAAQRKRMAEGQRRRYAALQGESEPAVAPAPPKPKRKISAEGIKRIIAATKKRWRLQKAAAKGAKPKKAAA